MGWKLVVPLAALVLVASAVAVEGHGDDGVAVLIDFGGGRFVWADVHPEDASNAWNATMVAAGALGLAVNFTLYGSEPFVNDIGDARPAYPDSWHFLLWDARWELADRGPASVNVNAGDAIAWFLTRDDPSWDYAAPWPGPSPEATPGDRYPVVGFRYGNEGLGAAPGEGPRDPVVDWKVDTGAFEISGTPAASHGIVYLPTWTSLLAVTDSGTVLWRNADVAGASSPALHGPLLYVGGRDGRLHALHRANGTVAWNVTLQADPDFSGITSSPRVAYGKIYIGAFNESGGDGGVFAFDLFTRERVWSRPVSSVHLSSPAIARGIVVVGLMGNFDPGSLDYNPPYGVLGLDAESGAERWFVLANGSVASSPAVAADVAYATSKAGELLAIGLDGNVLWTRPIAPTIASPAVAEGRVIVGDGLLGSNGSLRAFSTEGDLLWERPLTGPVSASPTVAGDLVYAATNEPAGRLVGVDLVNGTLEVDFVPQPPEYILSSPVVHGGALYLASDNGYLYRFEERVESVASSGFPDVVLAVSVAAVGGTIAVAGIVWWAARRGSSRGP